MKITLATLLLSLALLITIFTMKFKPPILQVNPIFEYQVAVKHCLNVCENETCFKKCLNLFLNTVGPKLEIVSADFENCSKTYTIGSFLIETTCRNASVNIANAAVIQEIAYVFVSNVYKNITKIRIINYRYSIQITN